MTFGKFMLRRFFSVAANNNKAYVELLFWKNVGAVREMTEGYSKDGLVPSFLKYRDYHTYGIYSTFITKEQSPLPFEMFPLILNMSERERNQHGLKRRKKSCEGSMRNTVILRVFF